MHLVFLEKGQTLQYTVSKRQGEKNIRIRRYQEHEGVSKDDRVDFVQSSEILRDLRWGIQPISLNFGGCCCSSLVTP